VGGCRKAGGAKNAVGDGAASSELKAPFKSQSTAPLVWGRRRTAYRTGIFKPWALTTPFAGTDKRERRARDKADNAPLSTTLSFPPFSANQMRKLEGFAR
jgi:hypothetical protein